MGLGRVGVGVGAGLELEFRFYTQSAVFFFWQIFYVFLLLMILEAHAGHPIFPEFFHAQYPL